jgi:hypothetical protein
MDDPGVSIPPAASSDAQLAIGDNPSDWLDVFPFKLVEPCEMLAGGFAERKGSFRTITCQLLAD